MSNQLDQAACREIISIKRCHGLGNVICLLPVLDRLQSGGQQVNLITRPEWVYSLSHLRPDFLYNSPAKSDPIDLDELTRTLIPREHRTDELGRLLGLAPPYTSLHLTIPDSWSQPYRSLRGSIVLAPEGGHPSRCWPPDKAAALYKKIRDKKIILIGTECKTDIPADVDTRGQLELHELLGLLSVACSIITMDSGVLHLATALDIPAVAIVGGVNPEYRIQPDQRVVVVQSKMDCCPCNKNEICGEEYTCIRHIQPQDVIKALDLLPSISRRTTCKVDQYPVQVYTHGV